MTDAIMTGTFDDNGGAGTADSGSQARVVSFLADPESYPDRPPSVDLIETHGARVFLAGPRAYKIKRAVKYDYLDFSTLAKRRAALEKEFAINHPHAPAIYQEVVAITERADGGLAIAGAGEPVEWALVMARFDQADLLSAVAARGELDTALAERVADAIAAYHETSPCVTDIPGAARIERTVTHLATSGLTDPALAGPDDLAHWEHLARQHLEANRSLLDERARAGAVRLAHGDLHLANIVVIDGTPNLFDAIEFDDAIRTVDGLYDLAFLLMDLEAKGCRPAANATLNRYLARPGGDADLDAVALLPLFLSLRAAIRAMVASQRARLATPDLAPAAFREARDYFEKATAFLTPAAPRLIAVGGLSGTGKTTLARALAPDIGPAPGALLVRTDIERKRLFGVPETTRLPPESYTPAASEAVYAAVFARAARIIAAGHSAICDAVFSKQDERDKAAAIAAGAGVPFDGLWLEAPPETMRARVASRTGDASDATPAVVDAQLAAAPAAIAWPRITAGAGPESTLAKARETLGLQN
jgi:aminoglycoside phosphotransferase family enzyme/predicted kinase